ncbi:SDR family NAD(P)-dependent oxidoreductase [Christiangramia crocea]|uniref:SDR family oxidoreductase n=1 Tax=Christiangramia crocea TaxID=2904124 RepID=A0A9X1UX83_9FLAO|nr:SDR family NAD(P)-dependent oxidoreductase [Gramella crocea]MCG9971666.1 SDR family oxidoreductase [Gramella crocea]
MKERLKGKRAVITGAAGGIGKATAELFIKEGAKVMLVDRNEKGLKEIASGYESGEVEIFVADVSKKEEVQKYADAALKSLGKIDIFFNNAGIEGVASPFYDYPDDVFENLLDINLKGVWYGCKYVIPLMSDNGSVILTSSIAGLKGFSGLGPYVASKHAVTGIMRVMALESAERKIRVNSVHPGPVNNQMMRSIEKKMSPDDPSSVQKEFEKQIPFQRYAENQDIAMQVLYLASEESAYITGTTAVVDGGMLL